MDRWGLFWRDKLRPSPDIIGESPEVGNEVRVVAQGDSANRLMSLCRCCDFESVFIADADDLSGSSLIEMAVGGGEWT